MVFKKMEFIKVESYEELKTLFDVHKLQILIHSSLLHELPDDLFCASFEARQKLIDRYKNESVFISRVTPTEIRISPWKESNIDVTAYGFISSLLADAPTIPCMNDSDIVNVLNGM